jgi:flagellar basal-body rod protein FlgG
MMNFNASIAALLRIGRSQSVTANNVANAATPGFKESRATFSDSGVTITANTAQGGIAVQGNALDVAVNGAGYLVVDTPQGPAYTRSGVMTANPGGLLSDMHGNPVAPPIAIPADARSVSIGSDGTVTADVGGQSQTLGQLRLAGFAAPGQLRDIGGNLMQASAGSGPAEVNAPGTGGTGSLVMGGLEMSNTDLAGNMVTMILDTHAFAYNVKAIKVQEQMNQSMLDIKA